MLLFQKRRDPSTRSCHCDLDWLRQDSRSVEPSKRARKYSAMYSVLRSLFCRMAHLVQMQCTIRDSGCNSMLQVNNWIRTAEIRTLGENLRVFEPLCFTNDQKLRQIFITITGSELCQLGLLVALCEVTSRLNYTSLARCPDERVHILR